MNNAILKNSLVLVCASTVENIIYYIFIRSFPVYETVFFVGVLLPGGIIFAKYEAHVSFVRKFVKISLMFGTILLISLLAGTKTSVAVWTLMVTAAARYHYLECIKNDIHPLTAEPKDKLDLYMKKRREKKEKLKLKIRSYFSNS